MRVFGWNLTMVARDVGVEVDIISTWRYYGADFVSLYETDAVNTLLNLPKKVFENYSAWCTVPGVVVYSSQIVMEVKDKSFNLVGVPVLGRPKKAVDIFWLCSKVYGKSIKAAVDGRAFDMIWSSALANKMDLDAFLEASALKC